jgi:drug/metabolite transporter (DMT)-like permease
VTASTSGQLAALGAAGLWAFTALAIDQAARRIGSLTVNLIRLVQAFCFLCLVSWIVRGVPFPVDASRHAWGWLALSGLVGFVFGDLCLYRSYLVIGPRLSTLMMSLVPLLTTVIGWLALGEVLNPRQMLGMFLTVGGIGWAVLDRSKSWTALAAERPGVPLSGLALAFGGALGQSGGLVLSKIGIGDYNAFAATQIRVLAGIAGYTLMFFVLRWWPNLRTGLRDRRALGFAALGAFFGPCIAVSLSLIAIRSTLSGVAASIMALTPVLIIPLVVFLRRERVGLGGVLGALVAVSGVCLLFLSAG